MAKQRSEGLQVRQNWIDRAIEYIDPVRAERRLRSRATLAITGQWVGARTDRRETAGWAPIAGSADADNLQDLGMLRARSRDMQRGEPIAAGAISTVVTKTIATGLTLRSVIDRDALGMSVEAAAVWQERTQRDFRVWANSPWMSDLRGELNFYGQQQLAVRSQLESGDVLALLPMKKRAFSAYSLKVQLIEADRLCNKDGAMDTPRLAGGIARDEDGMAVAYHILKQHPGGYFAGGREWDVVPAYGANSGRRNVVHFKEMLRPEQSRGMPYLAPVIEPLKQLGKYSNAELQAAIISAMFTVFVKTNGGVGLGIGEDGTAPTSTPKSGENVRLGNGAIVDLAPGEDIVMADPKRPNQAFDPFVLANLRQIGVGLELPFEVLVKHFTASYTAARAALLELWGFVKKKRDNAGSYFCDPIYEAWMWERVARDPMIAPGFFDDPVLHAAYLGAEWIGDAPGLLDPLKEVQAARERIDGKLSNRTIETLQLMGVEWSDVNDQAAAEEDEMRANGTMPEPPANAATPPPTDQPAQNGPDQPEQT